MYLVREMKNNSADVVGETWNTDPPCGAERWAGFP